MIRQEFRVPIYSCNYKNNAADKWIILCTTCTCPFAAQCNILILYYYTLLSIVQLKSNDRRQKNICLHCYETFCSRKKWMSILYYFVSGFTKHVCSTSYIYNRGTQLYYILTYNYYRPLRFFVYIYTVTDSKQLYGSGKKNHRKG